MNKYLYFIITILIVSINISCKESKNKNESVEDNTIPHIKEEFEEDNLVTPEIKKEPIDFIPKDYIIFDTIYGDLDKDGIEDLVYMIKGTDKSKIITHEYRGKLDRNRRGIIVLLNKKEGYELAIKNYDCFSSENEDGGVYYAPELSIEIDKGKLFISYAHGRYGYWSYTFRYQNNDLELIGYDASENHGPIVLNETSINFLTRQKIEKENTNRNYDPEEEEVFVETKNKIATNKLIKLSEIKDFDELEL